MLVSKEQILEWIDNPVTIAAWTLANWECDRVLNTPVVDRLYRGNPQKTQEQLVEDAEKVVNWTAFVNILNGHFRSEFINDDESLAKFRLVVEEYDSLVEEPEDEDSDDDEGEPE